MRVEDWKNANIQVFWGEIAPAEHLVQLYETEKGFLETLEGFAGSGLLSGDCLIIIATQEHLDELNSRLSKHGFNLQNLVETGQYMPLEANEVLASFMVNDWPDEPLFNQTIAGIIKRGRQNGRKIRAFGEMVALLWDNGHHGATVQLEKLWHQLHAMDQFTLYCAYPKAGFTQDVTDSLHSICKSHSKMIDGQARPSTEIYYQVL